MAARVTRFIDTIDVADIAFQLSCRFPKPSLWVRRHPEFVTRRRPQVVVSIEYAERFRARSGRPVGDTVADAAHVRRHGRGLSVSTGYYHAAVDLRRGRVAVRMAAFFDVGGLMRTLAALWLLERGTLLIRGACFGPRDSTTLACGLPDGATPSSSIAGWLAVTPYADGASVQPTPFVDRDRPLHAAVRRATTLWLPGADTEEPRSGAARALRVLLPSIWQADRRRPAVERTLDLATCVVMALERREIGAIEAGPREARVG